MAITSNGDARFEVLCSTEVARSILQLQRRASRSGRGKQVAEAFRNIISRLQSDPYQIGEPAYRLAALRMQIRTAALRPIAVTFGVCEDRRVVYIQSVKLLSG